MAVTIIEALQNAKINYQTAIKHAELREFVASVANSQQDNAIALLSKGYPADRLVEPLIEQFGSVALVPDYDEAIRLPDDVEE